MQTLRFFFALVAGVRAVLVYGEVATMASEPWALRQAERIIALLRWRPDPAAETSPMA